MATSTKNPRARKHLPKLVAVLDTTDEFVAAVPWGRWRSVIVYRRQHAGRIWLRLRTFNKHRTKGCWYPSPRFFVVPLDCAAGLAEAIAAGASGKQLGPEPKWYAEFEQQYAARRRNKDKVTPEVE